MAFHPVIAHQKKRQHRVKTQGAGNADPERKRVNAAMLAGALFNRATDLFTSIVDLGEQGIKVSENNELMRECSECFQEALNLGQQVKHISHIHL